MTLGIFNKGESQNGLKDDELIEFVDTDKLREERLKELEEARQEKDLKGPGVIFGQALKNPK